MTNHQSEIGRIFPVPKPPGCQDWSNYLYITEIFFLLCHYSNTPRQDILTASKGRFSIYFAAIKDIPFIKITSPFGPLYTYLNTLIFSPKDLDTWTAQRRGMPGHIPFVIVDLNNTIVHIHTLMSTRHAVLYETAKRMHKSYLNVSQVDQEALCILDTYSKTELDSRFIQIG